MEKLDDLTKEIVDAEAGNHVGSMPFEQENCQWSLLPAPTRPTSPAKILSNNGISTPKGSPRPTKLPLECPLRLLMLQSNFIKVMHMGLASQFGLANRNWRIILCIGRGSCALGKDTGRRKGTLSHLTVKLYLTFLKQDMAVRHTSM